MCVCSWGCDSALVVFGLHRSGLPVFVLAFMCLCVFLCSCVCLCVFYCLCVCLCGSHMCVFTWPAIAEVGWGCSPPPTGFFPAPSNRNLLATHFYINFSSFLLVPCFCDFFVFVFVMVANCTLVCFLLSFSKRLWHLLASKMGGHLDFKLLLHVVVLVQHLVGSWADLSNAWSWVMFLYNIWRDNDDNGRDGDNDHALYFYPAYGKITIH